MVGIICGTGVVLFLDLAMYLLRMNLYHAGLKLGKPCYKLFANETFDRLMDPSFKLVVFSAFKKQSQVLCEPLFRMAHEISEKYGFGNFEYYLRISEKVGEPRWDQEFFRKRLDLHAGKIYVHGPLGVEEDIQSRLRKVGVKQKQFYSL